MATITERRRRTRQPTLSTDELFETLDSAPSLDREELLFAQASLELETGRSRRGVYAMALTEADGDRDRARAGYMRRRVNQLEDEFGGWEKDREESAGEAERREAASADLMRTMLAMGLLLLAIIAIVSWT
jgi:hypothetical protein